VTRQEYATLWRLARRTSADVSVGLITFRKGVGAFYPLPDGSAVWALHMAGSWRRAAVESYQSRGRDVYTHGVEFARESLAQAVKIRQQQERTSYPVRVLP
jgi:hypothetical protein